MDNPGLFQESNKKYSITKRMLIFLIDGILTIGTIFALFFGICQFIIPSLANNEISQLNTWYQEICVSENVPYTEGTYGIYKIDSKKYILQLSEQGIEEDKLMETYLQKVDELDDKLAKVDGYAETYRKFNSIYLLNFISCICISTLIFELIIPLCNKRHKTIGMMIFKSNLVNRDNIVASNSKILLRFLFIQIVELIAVYLLINWIGILFETLITLVLISFTGNRYALHDLVTNLHVEEQAKSFTE